MSAGIQRDLQRSSCAVDNILLTFSCAKPKSAKILSLISKITYECLITSELWHDLLKRWLMNNLIFKMPEKKWMYKWRGWKKTICDCSLIMLNAPHHVFQSITVKFNEQIIIIKLQMTIENRREGTNKKTRYFVTLRNDTLWNVLHFGFGFVVVEIHEWARFVVKWFIFGSLSPE